MSTKGGPDNFGLWPNGDFRNGNANEWSLGTYVATGGPRGNDPYIQLTGGGGSGWTGTRIEVDPSETYKLVCYAKTFAAGSSGNNAGGHIGFACYDKNDSFIDLRHLKGIGQTTLTRTASPGDSVVYIADGSGFSNSTSSHQRGITFFPSTHPDYTIDKGYSRFLDYYQLDGVTNIGGGEYSVALDGTLPDWGYSLPAGTPVTNGRAGGTYNYALGAPTYPTTWTRYATGNFTGENRNSGTPFRYGTKYVRFMILRNYNRRTESPQDHVWGLSRIFFGKVTDGRDYNENNV